MIVFLAALQGIPGELYEAAELDGAGTLGKFVHITLPMISPAFLFQPDRGDHRLLAGVHTGLCHDRLGQPGTEGGPNNATLFVVLYLYKKAFQEFSMGYAASIAWVLFFLILVATVLQMKLARRWVFYEAEQQ